MKTVLPALVLVPLLLQAPRAGRTLHVPREFPTIQRAIDSAQSGDTVLVAPGRYFENLRLRGENIVLASEFILAHDTSVIARTVLDGSRPSHPDSGTVITIYKFEDSTTVVEGFTITGGTGTVWYDNKDKILFREGGGILVDLAGPTIRNNVITGNRADTARAGVLSAGGGGVRVGLPIRSWSTTSSPAIGAATAAAWCCSTPRRRCGPTSSRTTRAARTSAARDCGPGASSPAHYWSLHPEPPRLPHEPGRGRRDNRKH